MKLIDERTLDGSRQFASLPRTASPDALRHHLTALPGIEILHATEAPKQPAWVDFHYNRHHFFVKTHDGEYAIFVRDPQCADLILYQVGTYLEQLLKKPEAR
jgi:hypothetical protein